MDTNFDPYIGAAAGVGTSFMWTLTSLFFTAAGKRICPTIVNVVRIILAVIFLGVTHRAFSGVWIPQLNNQQLWYLAASGVIGLSIGDQALFVAFLDIGPRLTLLIMATSPLFAALFGWVALGEALGPLAYVAMLVTIGGVAWVVVERSQTTSRATNPLRRRGIALACVGSACQAGGLLLSKLGMGHGWMAPEQHLDPQAATLVRMVFAGVGVLPIVIVYGMRGYVRRAKGTLPTTSGSKWAGLLLTGGGAVVGPYLGVWMSLVASDRAPLGIAQTLCSLAPIFLLPFAAVMYKEHIGLRAILGAVIAVGGSTLLFFQPT